jgi:PIN domain nuclease of toxin-antitoxin system
MDTKSRRLMNYLIDTHVLLWWITADKRLSSRATAAIGNRRSTIFWSAASSWEISIKHALGRLEFDVPPEVLIPTELNLNRIETLAIQNEHAFLAGRLPLHHKDPFDRMLIAQAQIESLVLMSDDSTFKLYDIDLYW